MATRKPKKKFTRVKDRDYPQVSFTLPDIYGDAEFVLPDNDYIPLTVNVAGKQADFGPLLDWFADCGVDAETVDAIGGLAGPEFLEFAKAWGSASRIDLPKSED